MNREGKYETELTPALAAELLSKPHPRQRRPARMTVAEYARRIKEGRWRLVPDPIMVDKDGQMFNGAHRCAAVIQANRSIPVNIEWGADPSLFDAIDIGRFRSAFQFVPERHATAKASAARVTLWYERRFDRPLHGRNIGFDLHEILTEVDQRAEAFEAVLGAAMALYDYTSIAKSVSLAAFALAHDMGYREEVEAFVEAVRDPSYLPPGDPAKLLAERFRRQEHRGRRREMVDDWTLLVRAFNLQLAGREVSRLSLSQVWPRVAEDEAAYRRRAGAASAMTRYRSKARQSEKRGAA